MNGTMDKLIIMTGMEAALTHGEESDTTIYADASSLGLGKWPQEIEYRGELYRHAKPRREPRRDGENEVMYVTYTNEHGRKFTVFND